jgi:predicted transcriptional regulator
MLDAIPDDASFEDIQYHIYVLEKVERGLKAAEEGRLLSQEEVDQEISRWLKEWLGE